MMDNKLIYEWDEEKRQKNINERGLDITVLAPLVFSDPNVVIEQNNKLDYGEDRFRAYGLVEDLRLCVCFTMRENVVRLITIFKLKKKDWGKYYERKNN